MQTNRQIRVIKKQQPQDLLKSDDCQPASASERPTTERDVRAVVAGWVREHREGVSDYRHALATLFSQLDAGTPRAA